MKPVILFLLFSVSQLAAFSQNSKKLQKSWIKIAVVNLSQTVIEPDTSYTRYSFGKSKINIGFYPGWDDFQFEWAVNKDNLTIGFDTYHIEELTDSSLVFQLNGFRKFSFLAEEYLASREKHLDSIGMHNEKPLYRANKFITPRYRTGVSLQKVLQENTDGYNIKKATTFLLSFIVTADGKVENIKIIKGITDGFNNQIVKQLQATSKDWSPARYRSMPVQTEMFYEIKYLDSIVQ